MKRHLFSIATLFIFVALYSSTAVAADPDDFVDFSSEGLPGRLYIPPEAVDSPRPVILFLHGAGESGSDNLRQINGNINNLLAAAKQRGAFLYAPQATTVVGGIYNWNDTDRTTNVMQMVDQVLAEQHADASRLYVTGLSMGGGGTWNMLSRHSERFAAAVPIAGVRKDTDFDAAQVIDKPIWAFHARNDGSVSKDRSREVVDQILLAAGELTPTYPPNNDRETTFEFKSEQIPLSYTEYATGGHGVWPRVYATPEVYDWMFAQAVPEPSSAVLLLVAATIVAVRSANRLNGG